VSHVEKHLARSRVVELRSDDLRGAIKELIDASADCFPDLKPEALLRALLQREGTMTTYLGNGVALPHVRLKMRRRYVIAVGRSRAGIRHEGSLGGGERVHLFILLLADERAKDYLQVLASIARLVREPSLVQELTAAHDAEELFGKLVAGFSGLLARPVHAQQNKINRLMIREAERVARGADCAAIMVFGDTFVGGIQPGPWFPKSKIILVTRNHVDPDDALAGVGTDVIQVRSFSSQRLAQLRSAMFVALSRGLISFNDRVCCVGGIAGSNQFDTAVIVDVEREFQTLLGGHADLLPADVKPEVLERVLAIATELGVEGREGKPVGCLFVLGDATRVAVLAKPLVLNPFFGYKEEDRNILNPFMDETVKEFSSIDGAFVIRGDGVVESAGTLLQAQDGDHILPSGLGSRHAAAAAISVATDAISIVVSSSSGQVTLFRRGVMLPLSDRKVGH
jgi:diadenylate cyclase